MIDDMVYTNSQLVRNEEYEALCTRCGKCCGLETDPCVNLKKDSKGGYYCASYDTRLGRQVTISGRVFTCVPIREVVRKGCPSEGCSYGR